MTIEVYKVATRIVAYYQVAGSPHEMLASDEVIRVPFNQTATVRIEGQDEHGNVVPLSGIAWHEELAETYTLSPPPPPDPQKRILTPILIGSDPLPINADGDPSPGTAPLFVSLMVSVLDRTATHLGFSYDIENP